MGASGWLLGHTWGMFHRTIAGTGGLSRTPQICHLYGEMHSARALQAGFSLTRKRSQIPARPPRALRAAASGRRARPGRAATPRVCPRTRTAAWRATGPGATAAATTATSPRRAYWSISPERPARAAWAISIRKHLQVTNNAAPEAGQSGYATSRTSVPMRVTSSSRKRRARLIEAAPGPARDGSPPPPISTGAT